MMNASKTIKAVAIIAVFAALATIGWQTRLENPYPSNYVLRLRFLQYTTRENCSGFLANAHGEAYLTPDDFWGGVNGRMTVVEQSTGRAVDETTLQPGDVAAWHGDHVAAFMGNGVWIDMDARRGYATTWHLQDKPASDPWFSGPVRILRWKA